MKKKVGFIGIVLLFFNIFIFTQGALAEKKYKKEITVDEAGIYQENIEESVEIDWGINFPLGFNPGCIKGIQADYQKGLVKVGYSFECLFFETAFSLSRGGFIRVPIGEKWLMTIFEDGPKFISIPNIEIERSKFINGLGSIYFISIFILFGIIGYNYDYRNGDNWDKYFLLAVVGIGTLIVVTFNSLFLSSISEFWSSLLGLMYWIIFSVFIIFSVSTQINSNKSSLIKILIFISALLISLATLVFFDELKSNWERWGYFIFQMVLVGLAWSFGQIVLAWRKEKLLKPKMVRARRTFQEPLNFIEDESC